MSNHICLCEHCIEAIMSRGEKVIQLGSMWDSEEENMTCEWCEEEMPNDCLYDCIFP